MATITNLTFLGASRSRPSTSIPYWKNGQGAMIEPCEERFVLSLVVCAFEVEPQGICILMRWYQEPKFLIKMPPRRTSNINDVYVYERSMVRIEERLNQFVDQFANRMNDMMNSRRRGDSNGRRNEGEESKNPFFEGDDSSLFAELEEWEGFGGEEDIIEDVVVVANDICSSINQTTLGVNFEEDINTKSHELMSFGKSIIIKVSQSSFIFLIGKKYQVSYLKDAPMDDKLGFKTIKVRGRVIIKKREFDTRDANLDATSTRNE
nr:hypothetical protein [Tanacetum cinerariifolium]